MLCVDGAACVVPSPVLAVVALLAAGWAWWAAQPEPPAVRAEANRLPVAWYAEGELHLEDVVVELPDVEVFVADFADGARVPP